MAFIPPIKKKKGKGIIRRVSRLSKRPRVFVRHIEIPILRDRRGRKIEFGVDPLEQRAIPKDRFPEATLPERIFFKALATVMGGEEGFIFQRDVGGGRNFIGGFILDFIIIDRQPNIAVEILGSFWHQADVRYADQERALAVVSKGFIYEEVWDYELFTGDVFLEELILTRILGRRV